MVHLSEVGSMWLEKATVQLLFARVCLREFGFEVVRKYVAYITQGK